MLTSPLGRQETAKDNNHGVACTNFCGGALGRGSDVSLSSAAGGYGRDEPASRLTLLIPLYEP